MSIVVFMAIYIHLYINFFSKKKKQIWRLSKWSTLLIGAFSSLGCQSLLPSAAEAKDLLGVDLPSEMNNYCEINEERYDRVRDDLDFDLAVKEVVACDGLTVW